jgi:TolB-like protein/Tfp pilus assembly protein PilF/predicted Ser/Thr protein kinase
MTTASRFCRKCGATVPPDSPEESCGACLLEMALGSDEPVAGVHLSAVTTMKAGDPGRSPMLATARDDVVPASKKKAMRAAAMLGELGDYELLEEIGRGGQGVVFRARQKSLNRTVALKVVNLGQSASKAHLKRFRREAEAVASLDHSGIVPIYEVGERDGSCYFSMKFVEGGQLDKVVRRTPMSIRQAAELVAKVARTVHYAHEHGILHRDIKPGNVLLDPKGEPLLTDFGLARLVEFESTITRTMEVMGTPSYMAPEQAVGNNAAVSSATDVYGLGAVLYQLLTGQPPFAGGTSYETIRLLLDTEPRQPRVLNPKISRDLSTICLKCLEKDPKHRYSSALALAEDLERWLKHEPIQARHAGVFTRGRKWVQRNPTSALLVAALVAFAAAVGWNIWKSELIRGPITTGIAVLPFENLGEQKENLVFADGVQDDILTKLAKINNLKVISRTSVMEYRGKRNVREIGDALRVSHVLEGSARRSGDRVHLNAQLIDTRTDTHVWAEEYDRNLNDLFAVQSEIAQKVAQHLHAKLSASEQASIEERPTQDLVAYDFYAQAVSMIYNVQVPSESTADTPFNVDKTLSEAVDLLNKAVARDPNFFLAYCQLAFAHDLIGNTPARLALAKSAIDSAFRLRPNSGEAHLALGWHLYWGYADYDRARAELALAQQSLPNNPVVYELAGSMDRSQSRWADATQNLERACELDPRNLPYLINLGSTYLMLHDYDQHTRIMDRIVALHPERRVARIYRASVEVGRRADTGAWRAAIENVLTNEPGSEKDPFVAGQRYTLALYDRDWDTASSLAAMLSQKHSLGWSFPQLGRDFWVGAIARLKGDETSARAAFIRARAQQEEEIRGHPDDVSLLVDLGLIDAGLRRKEEALNEGRRAMELGSKDSDTEQYVKKCFAIIGAWTGERELALGQLEALAKTPGSHTYGNFRLSPMWDPLRGDPRFEKIVASLAPK